MKQVRASSRSVKRARKNGAAIKKISLKDVKGRYGVGFFENPDPSPEDLKTIPEASDEQLARMRSIHEWRKIRKTQIALRVDDDVLAWFKSAGEGYQSRMNEALRRAMLSKAL